MTIGIYGLYWPDIDSIYIGQSIEIEQRWLAHSSALRRRDHANNKMLRAYEQYGEPEYFIIDIAAHPSELNELEIYWCSQFNNILNIQEPGVQTGHGTKNPNSRYSRKKILRVFIYLYKYGYSQPKTSKLTNIPRGTISHIVHGKSHIWLKEEFPVEYAIMLEKAKRNISNKSSD